MNYRIMTKIACRMLAIYFLITCMNYIPGMLISLSLSLDDSAAFASNILSWLSTGLFMLLAAVLLWIFADRISAAILRGEQEDIEKFEADYNKIAIIAFSFAGLFVLLNAIPDIIRMIIQHNWQMSIQQNYEESRMYIESVSIIIGEVVQIALGLWLLLGSKGTIGGIKALRTLGQDRIENMKDEAK